MPTENLLSRRTFLKQSLAATAALATSHAPLFSEPISADTRRFTYCGFEKPLQFLSFDDVAAVMADAGYNGIEAAVRDKGHVLPERVEEDLPKMHEALKKRGLEITILTSSIDSIKSPHAEKVLRTAAKLGIKRYRMLWYRYDLRRPIQEQLNELRPKIAELVALNRELGLTALYQNHSGADMVGAPLWDIYGLIKDFNPQQIALAYDIRHATVEGGLSWPIQFNLVKSHIGAVCIKDFVWENRKVKNVPLGEGVVDRKFFALLKETTFTGPVSVHVEYLERSRDQKQIGEAFRKDLVTTKEWLV